MSAYTNYTGSGPVYPANYGYTLIVPTVSPFFLDFPFNHQTGVANHFTMPLTTAIQSALTPGVAVLPDATQVAPGWIVYISSIGAQSVTIQDNGRNVLAAIASGLSYKFTLTDNTTAAGEWLYIVEGAGTAEADAGALAGYGLTALVSNTKLNTNSKIVTLNTSTTLDITARANLYVWTGGSGTITLPDPTTTDIENGFYVDFNNESDIGGVLTINNPFGDIDQSANTTTLQIGSSGRYVSDGNKNYYSFGVGVPTYYNPGLLQFSVATGTYNLTPLQCALNVHIFSGTLTGNVLINYTDSVNFFYIFNATTGPHTLSVQNSAAVPIVLEQGLNYIVVNIGPLNNGLYTFPSVTIDLENASYILQTPSAFLPNSQPLSKLSTGILKSTTTTGVVSIAVPGTDYLKNPVPNIQFAVNGTIPTPVANTMFMQLNEQSNFAFISTIGTLNLLFNDANNNFIFATPSALTTGQGNTIINPYSALALSTGSNNTIYGHTSGASFTKSNATTIIGAFAGQTVTNITNGSLFGYGATFSSDNLTNATAIGAEAAVNASNTLVLGNGANVAIGAPTAPYALSLQNNNGTQAALWLSTNATPPAAPANGIVLSANTNNNLLFTYSDHSLAFYSDTKSNAVLGLVPNINVGGGAMTNLLWGGNTTYAITTGFNNVCTGFGAGVAITTGSYNVLSGVDALADTTTGANNVAVGSSAGRGHDGQNNCVFIGGNTLVGAANLTNAIAIGYGSVISSSNAMLLGNGANVLIGSGTTPTAPESLNLLSANGSAGLYFATSPDTRTAGGRSGGVFSVDANDIPRYTSLAIAGGNNSANIDTYPQPYYQCSATLGTNVGPLPGASDFLPFVPAAALTGILNNGYPGGYYPNAVLALEFGYSVSGGTPGNFTFNLQVTKVVGVTKTAYNGVPSNPRYFWDNPGTIATFRVTANVLLSDIVDAAATGWGITINNEGSSPDFLDVTQATSLINAYIITGGVN